MFAPLGHQPVTRASMDPSEELNLLMSTVFTLPITAKCSFVLLQFPEMLPIITVCVREVYLIKPKDKDYFS